jgi:heat shock protein HtpX
MLRRLGFFLLTNICVVITISFVLNILGVGRYITASGLNYGALAVFCLVWGMVGSLISLMMSRIMAKMFYRVQVIDTKTSGEYAWLVQSVHDLARKAKLPAMPEVGVYDSPEVNAFATGPTKARSLVAVSTGLIAKMNRDELEGVLGHEIAHIQNGDMVTMTMIAGVVNAFSMFIARIVGFAISQSVDEEKRGMVQMLVVFVLDIVLTLLGSMVVAYFSRKREFRADRGSALLLGGRRKMVEALESLGRMQGLVEPAERDALATLKISSGRKGGIMSLFSTHPPLEERINALERSSL